MIGVDHQSERAVGLRTSQFHPTYKFEEDYQEAIDGIEYMTHYDHLIEQINLLEYTTKDQPDLMDRLVPLLLVTKDAIATFLDDEHCPNELKQINETITTVLANSQDPTKWAQMNRYLSNEKFAYFFKPLDQPITIVNQQVRPSLFFADAMTMIGSLETQLAKVKNYQNNSIHQLAPDKIMVDNDEIRLSNPVSEQDQSLESLITFEPFETDKGLILIKDEEENNNFIFTSSEFKRALNEGRNTNHPFTRKPYDQCKLQILIPKFQSRQAFVGIDLSYQWLNQLDQLMNQHSADHNDSLFQFIPDAIKPYTNIPTDSNNGLELATEIFFSAARLAESESETADNAPVAIAELAPMVAVVTSVETLPVTEPSAPPLLEAGVTHRPEFTSVSPSAPPLIEESGTTPLPEFTRRSPSAPPFNLINQNTTATTDNSLHLKWMYQANDPLQYQFSNLQPQRNLTSDQVMQSISAAIDSMGQSIPIVSKQSLAIDRFFTHWRNEMRYFKQANIKTKMAQIQSVADINNDDLMKVSLARFNELLKIKQAFLAYWERPIDPIDMMDPEQQLAALKNEINR